MAQIRATCFQITEGFPFHAVSILRSMWSCFLFQAIRKAELVHCFFPTLRNILHFRKNFCMLSDLISSLISKEGNFPTLH